MQRPTFTLAFALLVMLAIGFEIAPLATGSAFWLRIQFTATLALLLFSIIKVTYSREHRRAFWLGFALFGWAALLADVVPWFDKAGIAHQFAWESVAEAFPTEWEWSRAGTRQVAMAPGGAVAYIDVHSSIHYMFVPMFALLGAVLAQWAYAKRPAATSNSR